MSEIPDTTAYLIAGYTLFVLGTAAYIIYLTVKWKKIVRLKSEQADLLKRRQQH